MNRRNDFWERVDEAWDARRDPLEDAALQRLISEDPGLLDELRRVERGLCELRAPQARRSRWAHLMIAAAAAGLALAWIWSTRRDGDGSGDAGSTSLHAQRDAAALASESHELDATPRILALRIVNTLADARGVTEVELASGVRSTRFVAATAPASTLEPRLLYALATVVPTGN